MRLTRACLSYGLYTIDGSSMIINVLGYIELELTEPTPDFPNLSPLRSQTRTSSQDPTDKYHPNVRPHHRHHLASQDDDLDGTYLIRNPGCTAFRQAVRPLRLVSQNIYDPKAMRINRGSQNKASPKRKAKRDPDESDDDEDDEGFEIKVSSRVMRVSCSNPYNGVLMICSVRTVSLR